MATKDVSWGPGSDGPGGGRVFAPWAREGRQRGAWLPLGSSGRSARNHQAAWLVVAGAPASLRGLSGVTQGSFLSLFFHHRLCLLAGVALMSEMVPERRAFSIPERGGPRLHHEL